MNKKNWKEIEEKKVRDKVYRKVFTGENITLAITRLEKGHSVEPHSHIHEQIVHVQEGKVEFMVDGNSVILEEDGLLLVPPNAEHCAKVLEGEEARLLEIFTPVREDLLK